jgi:hypothetical protein
VHLGEAHRLADRADGEQRLEPLLRPLQHVLLLEGPGGVPRGPAVRDARLGPGRTVG